MAGLGHRFRTFCQTTSCHGFPQLSNSQTLAAKILWSVLIGFLSLFLIYNTTSMFVKYFSEDRRWSTQISEDVESALQHPTITICNYNRFRKSVIEKLEIPEKLMKFLYETNPAAHALYRESVIMEAISDWVKWRLARNLTGMKAFEMFSHQCEGMVKMLQVTVNGFQQIQILSPCEVKMANGSATEMGYVVPFDMNSVCPQLRVDRYDVKYKLSTTGGVR